MSFIYSCILHTWNLDPWSWPGMTASLAFVMFCGWLLVFRHKNIRTKGYHWFLNVFANEFATHSLINVFAPVVLSFQLFLLNMNIRFFLLFLLRILCFALQFFFAMMDIRMYGQKLVSALTVEWTLFVFLCSFVLMSLFILCFVLSPALCCHWDKVPGPGQGWRIAGTCAKRVLQGKTQSCALLGKTQTLSAR